jgi:epothilone polyketide synthase D
VALRELADLGVRVRYAAVDVADEDAVRAAVSPGPDEPPVRGVLHAAGVLRYYMVDETPLEELSLMLRPKLAGGRALRAALAGQPLDFFVLYSSGSAILASPLIGAYAAANAALDALACQWRREGLPVLTVNWGFWSEVGMAARSSAEQGRSMAPTGIGSFSPAEGIGMLERLLAEGAAQAMVMPADWAVWAATYPEAASSTLLADLVPADCRPAAAPAVAPPAAPVSPAVAEPAVPVSPAVAEPAVPVSPAVAPPAAPVSPAPAQPAAPGSRPAGVEGSTDLTDPLGYLVGQVAAVLGLPESQVSARRPLSRQGMDSLMAVAVRNRVQQELGVTLPIAKLLGDRSLTELADELARTLAERAGR